MAHEVKQLCLVYVKIVLFLALRILTVVLSSHVMPQATCVKHVRQNMRGYSLEIHMQVFDMKAPSKRELGAGSCCM